MSGTKQMTEEGEWIAGGWRTEIPAGGEPWPIEGRIVCSGR